MSLRELPKNASLALLRAYRWVISPIIPPACRFTPTCSEYAAEAIDRHGALRGSMMGVWRLLRCHPFTHGGYDPVPLCANNPAAGLQTRKTLWVNLPTPVLSEIEAPNRRSEAPPL